MAFLHTCFYEPSVKGHQMRTDELTGSFICNVALSSTVLDWESSQIPCADCGRAGVEVSPSKLTCPRKLGRTMTDTLGKNGDTENLVFSIKMLPLWMKDKAVGTSKAKVVMPRCLQTAGEISSWISSGWYLIHLDLFFPALHLSCGVWGMYTTSLLDSC